MQTRACTMRVRVRMHVRVRVTREKACLVACLLSVCCGRSVLTDLMPSPTPRCQRASPLLYQRTTDAKPHAIVALADEAGDISFWGRLSDAVMGLWPTRRFLPPICHSIAPTHEPSPLAPRCA